MPTPLGEHRTVGERAHGDHPGTLGVEDAFDDIQPQQLIERTKGCRRTAACPELLILEQGRYGLSGNASLWTPWYPEYAATLHGTKQRNHGT
ncbi:hypothetical protein [Streptomyces sp. LARHCF252]